MAGVIRGGLLAESLLLLFIAVLKKVGWEN
jgi:hypothetical protein